MGPSLTYRSFVDWLTASGARVAGLLVNLEMILEISTPVDPVNTGSVGFNTLCQSEPDGFQQPLGILQVKRFAGLEGVNACSVEGLIRVNVPHSSQEVLIQ